MSRNETALYRLLSVAGFLLATLVFSSCIMAVAAQAKPVIADYIKKIPANELVSDATAYGPMEKDLPIVPILKGHDRIGYAFITSDFVSTTGYSGKPIHVMVAIDPNGVLLRALLVKHSEPIVLVGIPNSKMKALTESYRGLNVVKEAAAVGSAHDLNIISGATVTVMIIDDSIVRASIKVARALGLGGLEAEAENNGPAYVLNTEEASIKDWATLTGDGSVRRLTLDVGQINKAFAESGDPRALKKPAKGDPSETFIDLNVALVSVPGIGRSLLGEAEYANLRKWLKEGEQAILVMGRGQYSFKGSGYVRGGIFDRIKLIQGDVSVRFRDHDHRRVGKLAAEDAPSFKEMDLFKIPAKSGFEPTKPWRLQLLIQRAVGPVEKAFITYDLGYSLPSPYLTKIMPAASPKTTSVPVAEDNGNARALLWKRIWQDKIVEVGLLIAMLTILTGVFFFQVQATRNARAFYWFRMGFLAVTLIFLGWSQNAQLSVVNLMALGSSLVHGFSWDAFLMDPLVFILWTSVAVTLLFWGRGGFCGWLCPFGALQEITNQIARFFKVPQLKLPWGLHERLWPIKYMIFLGLIGVAIVSIPLAEHLAEVEPFKTSIVLKFARGWPYVLYAAILLGIGLFIERFYCRYLCPLGAALAIPARMRMFDWLKRYRQCGNPCQTCANECFVQAIHPTGEINPNECLSCLHCQVLYQDRNKCPVVIKRLRRHAAVAKSNEALKKSLTHPQQSKGN